MFPTVVTNGLLQATYYTCDSQIPRPLTMMDPNNAITQYNYQGDSLDRLTSEFATHIWPLLIF